jgi:TatA/E family protein of Tat protein translocase
LKWEWYNWGKGGMIEMFNIGMQELLVILLICLLIFGANKLPEIGRALGKTVKEFKKAMEEIGPEEEEKKEVSLN